MPRLLFRCLFILPLISDVVCHAADIDVNALYDAIRHIAAAIAAALFHYMPPCFHHAH